MSFVRKCQNLFVVLLVSVVTQSQVTAQTTQPAATKTTIKAKAIEVNGSVDWAGLDGNDWKPVKLNDEFNEQTKFRTGVKSSLKLQIGDEAPYSCMLVDAVGKTVLSEAWKNADTKRVRVGVAYGKVRAGVAEGGLKSDFTVDSADATLSKKGTWGFELFYSRDGQFEIGLTDFGLVEAISKVTGERRDVQPGQRVTEAMRRWLDQASFRNVPVADVLGQSDIEVAFNRLDAEGLGVTGVGSGRSVLVDLSNANARNQFAQIAQQALQSAPPLVAQPGQVQTLRSEGFFGTGRGDQLISFIIDSRRDNLKQIFPNGGRFQVRRDVLESWIKTNSGH